MKIEDEIKHSFSSPQQRAFTNIIFTSNWVLNKIAVALKPTGLSLQQFNALSILHGQKDHKATVSLIKERLIDRMPNVSRLLNKLVEKGFVEKTRDTTDQRVVYIKLTPFGLKVKEQGRLIIDKGIFDLNDEESNTLNGLLEKIRS